jgi:hypothetical protein
MNSATIPAPVENKPLSEGERILDTFIAPTKTFTDLRRNSSWWAPWLLMAIVGWGMVVVVDKKVGMDKVVENQMALSPKQAAKLDQLPPEQRASQMETIVKFNRGVAYAYPLLTLLIVAVMAGVLLATFKFGFGAELTFMQCMAVTMYAFLPGVIKAILAIVAVTVGGGEGFTFQNPVASNLSGLIDPSSHFLYSLATSVDIFTIWTLVLTAIGYSCLTKVKLGTCVGVVFGWWIFMALLGSGVSALFA